MKFKEKLKKLGDCDSMIEWVGDRDLKTAWAECKRGDWMFWLIKKSNSKVTLPMRKKLVLCACDIADTVLEHVPKDEKRPAEAIRIARSWAHGEKISLDEIKSAAHAAAHAAAYAAYAADAANAVYAAAYAAYAAAYAAAHAAAYAAKAADAAYAATYAAYADIVRKYFPKPPKFET